MLEFSQDRCSNKLDKTGRAAKAIVTRMGGKRTALGDHAAKPRARLCKRRGRGD